MGFKVGSCSLPPRLAATTIDTLSDGPVNFRLAGPELQAVLQGSGARAIVCEDGHRDTLDAVRDQPN
jgi:hypothetical protein